MRGIAIILNGETVHTGNDLGLVQTAKEIGKPTVQTYTVQVPGRNGLLNLTKGLTGSVCYYNRQLHFQYVGDGTREQLLQLDAELSRFHGETVQIVDDDHPGHFYEGEVIVSSAFGYGYITITLDVDAQPFRLKRSRTVHTQAINGETTITLNNESIEATPTITVTAETYITFNGVTVHLSKAGTYADKKLTLRRGANTFSVEGTGTIKFDYQEGAV